MKLIGTKM